MPLTLDIRLTPTDTPGTYLAEGYEAGGTVVGQQTFTYRADLIRTHQQLRILEQGAVLGGDETTAPALRQEAETFGHELYGRILSGDLGEQWQQLRAQAQAGGQPARLRLRIDPAAPELNRLPWEFLHDGQGFVAPNRQVLFSRAAAGLPDVEIPATHSGPLAVLVIVSTPLDLPDPQAFEPDEELAMIYEALDDPLRHGQIQLDVVDEASVSEIQRALIERDYQVIHFIGHGSFAEATGGYLVIEDDQGHTTRLTGEHLATLLAGRGVRLVLLSSCLTAQGSATQAYRSVAGALLQRGVPAVVAMQYPILITSARSFFRTVYRALVANRPLDIAVAEGRQTLYLERDQTGLDWATPALFSQGVGEWRLAIAAPTTPPPPPHLQATSLGGLELMAHGFVGRQREQRRIRRALLRNEARAVLIHGFGGIGKTVLATRVAHRLAETGHFEGVLGLRARPDTTADEILQSINTFFQLHGITQFEPVLRAPIPLAPKVDALGQLLRQRRLLLIFDNCEDWLAHTDGHHHLRNEDLTTLLAGLLTTLDQGSKLILTSRYTFNPLRRGRLSSALLAVPLGELSRDEAIRLMGRLPALREADFTQRLRVFEAVGGHPFVLNLFAERAARDGVDYVLADVAGVRREAADIGHLLLEQIITGLSETARGLLLRAGLLRRPAPREAWEALAGTHRIGDALAELLDWGLLTQAQFKDELCHEPETRYPMHALVREYTSTQLTAKERQAALPALAAFYQTKADEETQYIDLAVFNRLEARHYYFAAGQYELAGEIDQRVNKFLLRWGLLDLARDFNRQIVGYAAGAVQAAALHHLGIIERQQGNYAEALSLCKQSLKINEELGDKAGVAASLHQMGMLQQHQGNYTEALRLYEQSLKIKEELGDKTGLATSLHQMGNLQSLQGNYAEALSLYEQSLKIEEEIGDEADLAASLHQIGNLQYLQGNYAEALSLYKQSLKPLEELGDKAGVAASLHQMGMIQQHQGNYAEALRLYEQSLKIKEELGDKAGLAASLHQMGNLQYLQGNYAEALRLCEQSLKIREGLGDKADIAASLHQMGMFQQHQGNYAEALRLYEQSLKIAEGLGDKAGLANSLGQMGKLAQTQGQLKEAMRYYLQALGLFQALNSPYADLAKRDLVGIQAEIGEEQFAVWWEELAGELGLNIGAPAPAERDEEGMTVEAVLNQIVQETLTVMRQDDPAPRQQLWEALDNLRAQVGGQAELKEFVAFLDAVCHLLEGSQTQTVELAPPFAAAWQQIQDGLAEG